MSEPVKVTVRRKQWIRGEGTAESYLLRDFDGKMCCLGFACLALGMTPDKIGGQRSPGVVAARYGRDKIEALTLPVSDYGMQHPDEVSEAMMANDTKYMEDDQREAAITRLLAEVGLEMEFVDE